MERRRSIPLVTAGLALTFALHLSAGTNAAQDSAVIVNFGDKGVLVGVQNQVVDPGEATVIKGGVVTFVVNGPGHGLAIYPVAKKTTRDDITAQLCGHDPATHECTDPAFVNGDHTIRDGQNTVVIMSGTNPPFQRIDDPTNRLLGTTTQIDGVAGPFLPGTTPGTPVNTPGTQLQFRFTKTGRYLVVCMNRSHYLANWMFGFVNVVDEGDSTP